MMRWATSPSALRGRGGRASWGVSGVLWPIIDGCCTDGCWVVAGSVCADAAGDCVPVGLPLAEATGAPGAGAAGDGAAGVEDEAVDEAVGAGATCGAGACVCGATVAASGAAGLGVALCGADGAAVVGTGWGGGWLVAAVFCLLKIGGIVINPAWMRTNAPMARITRMPMNSGAFERVLLASSMSENRVCAGGAGW